MLLKRLFSSASQANWIALVGPLCPLRMQVYGRTTSRVPALMQAPGCSANMGALMKADQYLGLLGAEPSDLNQLQVRLPDLARTDAAI